MYWLTIYSHLLNISNNENMDMGKKNEVTSRFECLFRFNFDYLPSLRSCLSKYNHVLCFSDCVALVQAVDVREKPNPLTIKNVQGGKNDPVNP